MTQPSWAYRVAVTMGLAALVLDVQLVILNLIAGRSQEAAGSLLAATVPAVVLFLVVLIRTISDRWVASHEVQLQTFTAQRDTAHVILSKLRGGDAALSFQVGFEDADRGRKPS